MDRRPVVDPRKQTIYEWLQDYDREEERMDMSQFVKDGNTNDLKAKDFIGKNLKLTIERVEVVKYEASDNQPANSKAALYFVGKEKRLILNSTNTETLCNAYGPDDSGWAGKEIALTTKDYTDKGFGHGWIVTPLQVEFNDDIPFALLLPTALSAGYLASEIISTSVGMI